MKRAAPALGLFLTAGLPHATFKLLFNSIYLGASEKSALNQRQTDAARQ